MLIRKISLSDIKTFKGFHNDVKLSNLNVIIGGNNTGKTALLNSILCLSQKEKIIDLRRIGSENAGIHYTLEHVTDSNYSIRSYHDEQIDIALQNEDTYTRLHYKGQAQPYTTPFLKGKRDDSPIRTFLSERFSQPMHSEVSADMILFEEPSKNNLVALIESLRDRQAPPTYEDYSKEVKEILGIEIRPILSKGTSGKRIGYPIHNGNNVILLEQMGAGVKHILSLIYELITAQENIFIIDEIETSLHPKALKALLDLIVKASETNQFIIATHSNIVISHLLHQSRDRTNIIKVESAGLDEDGIPFSMVSNIEDSHQVIQLLGDIGYSLSDSFLYDKYIIFEEASAEYLFKEFIVPKFKPNLLGKVRTISSNGSGGLEKRFRNLKDHFLSFHIANKDQSLNRNVFIIADGDPETKKIVERLREEYSTWPKETFRNLEEDAIERYYPEHFKDKVYQALSEKDPYRKALLKGDLVKEVVNFLQNDSSEFKEKAKELIDMLDFI